MSHPMQAKQVFRAYCGEDDDGLGHFECCPSRGSPLSLQEKSGKQRPACPACGLVQFRNPAPGAVVLVEKDGQVLLGRRSGSYGAGK